MAADPWSPTSPPPSYPSTSPTLRKPVDHIGNITPLAPSFLPDGSTHIPQRQYATPPTSPGGGPQMHPMGPPMGPPNGPPPGGFPDGPSADRALQWGANMQHGPHGNSYQFGVGGQNGQPPHYGHPGGVAPYGGHPGAPHGGGYPPGGPGFPGNGSHYNYNGAPNLQQIAEGVNKGWESYDANVWANDQKTLQNQAMSENHQDNVTKRAMISAITTHFSDMASQITKGAEAIKDAAGR